MSDTCGINAKTPGPMTVVLRFTETIEVKAALHPIWGPEAAREVARIAGELLVTYGHGRNVDPASIRVSLE